MNTLLKNEIALAPGEGGSGYSQDNTLLDLHNTSDDDTQPHLIIAKYQLCYLGNWVSLYRIKRFYNFTGVPTSSTGRFCKS